MTPGPDDDEADESATIDEFSDVELGAPGGWKARLRAPGTPTRLVRLAVTALLVLLAFVGALALLLAQVNLWIAVVFPIVVCLGAFVWWRKGPGT